MRIVKLFLMLVFLITLGCSDTPDEICARIAVQDHFNGGKAMEFYSVVLVNSGSPKYPSYTLIQKRGAVKIEYRVNFFQQNGVWKQQVFLTSIKVG